MRSPYTRIIPVIAAVFLAIVPARAEDADAARGRLPDGRAFRTDNAGNQLVDYIAELEVNNEALTRQVKGLQEELDSKQHSIDRLSSGSARVAPEFAEKDLLHGSTQRGSTTTTVASAALREPQCPRCELCAPPVTCPPAVDCAATIRPLKDQLEQTKLNLEIERKQRSSSQNELQTLVSKLQAQLDLKAVEIEKRGEEVENVKQSLRDAESKRQAAETQLRQVNARLDAAGQQIEGLERAKASLTSERDAARVDLKEAGVRAAELQSAALRVAPPPPAPMIEQEAPSPAKIRALESVRGSVQNEANKLRGLISDRDRAFAQYNSGAHRVGIRPSSPVSSRNLSAGALSESIQRAASVAELMQLRRDVSEIRGKMQEDIALASRMGRVH